VGGRTSDGVTHAAPPLLSLILASALAPASIAAQPPAVTFDEALALAHRSPAAETARRELAARESADDGIGGTAQATTITVTPGAGSAADQGWGFEGQVSVAQGWNLADLGGARRRAAGEERAAIAARARADALRARLEAARYWIDLHTLQSLASSLEERRALVRRRVELAERAREAGVGTAEQLAVARAEAAQVERQRVEVEGDRVDAARQLARAMGADPSRIPLAAGPVPRPRLPGPRAVRARIANLDALPDVAVRRLTATAARAREAEASAEYGPVLSLGAQLERGGGDTWVVYGIASLQLDLFGSERRVAAVERGAAARADVELETARLRARADLEQAAHDVGHSTRALRVIERELLPALDDLVARLARAVEAGERTRFALFDARRRRSGADEAAVRARGARAWARVRLWLLLAELAPGGAS